VIQAGDGNLYGELNVNGGTIFQVTPGGVYKPLYQSQQVFWGGLTEASNGLLYGVGGVVFSISKSGTYRTVHAFGQGDGSPQAGLTLASDGYLYGSTSWNQSGVGNGPAGIFRVSLDGSIYSMVYSFGDQFAGVYSLGPSVIQGSDGKLYGAQINGVYSQIFSLDLGLPKPQPAPLTFHPRTGAAGTQVLIAGKNLLGATAVSFNGIAAASFENRGGRFVAATVPVGAASGPITVTTANGQGSTPGSFVVK